MKLESFINQQLERAFGTDKNGERIVWFHWQNLNEKIIAGEEILGPGWKHGRAWLHTRGAYGQCLHTEWHFGDIRFSVGVDFKGSDKEVLTYLCVPGASIYLGLEGILSQAFWQKAYNREISLRIHDWKIWLECWADSMGWDSKDPWWQRQTFDVKRFLLGKQKYKNEELAKHDIKIPMPEGLYSATATFERSTWKRPRWPKTVQLSTKVDIPKGIPFQGKGENSWDCGTDGLYGYSVEGHDLDKAIAHGVESVLKYRQRYDGSRMATYPAPSEEVTHG